MGSIKFLTVLFISLIQSLACMDISNFKYDFYITSGTNDWVVSSQYPSGVYSSITSADNSAISSLPEASWIWENPRVSSTTIVITKQFFTIGKPYSAIFQGAIDDSGSVRLNGGTLCVIGGFTTLYVCDFSSDIKSGMNVLEITADDYSFGGFASVKYKLKVKTNLV